MKNKQLEFGELVEKWQVDNKIYHFEGTTGVDRFEKLCKVLGYTDGNYFNASPILNFLSDNSGAIDALVNWIKESGIYVDGWKKNLLETWK